MTGRRDRKFDKFGFQGMDSLEALERYRRNGQALFNDGAQSFVLKTFSDDTRPNIAAAAFSDSSQKLPTVMTDEGDCFQIMYDPDTLRISAIRALPRARNPRKVVQLIMAALLEESGGDPDIINPENIVFGQSEQFARTYKGEWENAYRRYLATRSLSLNPLSQRGAAAEDFGSRPLRPVSNPHNNAA